MREIKFRALDENDEWIYGMPLTHVEYEEKEFPLMRNCDETGYWGIKKIHPKTLGQYTGLKDKNGAEIYEGDIVKITNTKRFLGGNYKCYSNVKIMAGHVHVWVDPVINGKRVRHGAKMLHGGMAKYIDMRGVATEDVEVIGNIYENPELLEREAE